MKNNTHECIWKYRFFGLLILTICMAVGQSFMLFHYNANANTFNDIIDLSDGLVGGEIKDLGHSWYAAENAYRGIVINDNPFSNEGMRANCQPQIEVMQGYKADSQIFCIQDRISYLMNSMNEVLGQVEESKMSQEYKNSIYGFSNSWNNDSVYIKEKCADPIYIETVRDPSAQELKQAAKDLINAL